MEEKKSLLVAWLNDAYAMEQAQMEMLGKFIKDFGAHDDIKEKLQAHLEETKIQADTVQQCIESLGEKVSPAKSLLGNIIGTLQGMSTGPYKDELVKNMIIIHTSEHFEHATYLAIAAAAKSLGEDEIAKTCQTVADEEKSVAEWSEQYIPRVVDTVLGYENNTP